jgi:hypothetical protein
LVLLEGESRVIYSGYNWTQSSLIAMLIEDALQSRILAEDHSCSSGEQTEKIPALNARSTTSLPVSRNHLSTVTQQEENHIKRLQNENKKAPTASALIGNNCRVHLKLSLLKGVISTTLLTVTANPPPTFLDHLLTSDASSPGQNRNKNENNNRSVINGGISGRLVVVSTYFCKDSLATFFPNKNKNVPIGTLDAEKHCGKAISYMPNMTVTVTDIAQNGFIYHGHRFQFLLSKDPKDKISYFLQDDCSDRIFPDANSLRNYIADFSSQPSIFRAG